MKAGDLMRKVMISLLTLSFHILSLCPGFAQAVSWIRTDKSLSGSVNAIAVDDSFKVFVTTYQEIYVSSNQGDNWTLVNSGPYTCLAFGTDTILYVGNAGGSILFSTDHGSNWGYTASPTSKRLYVIGLDSRRRLLAGSESGSQMSPGGLYRSTDHGSHWSHFVILPQPEVTALLVPQEGTILIPWYRSTDDGVSWTSGSPPWTTTAFALGAGNGIISGNSLKGGNTSGIYLSSDDGATWISAVPGLPGVSVNCLVQSRLGVVFAGTTAGVYLSKDGGLNWDPVNDGLTQLNVHALAVDSVGYLYAGTDSGAFRSIQPTTSIGNALIPRPTQISLSQNYPNPFNPTTSIRYDLPTSREAKLTVYDVLGREVTVLLNTRSQPGTHEVRFDGSNLSSGVYFYRLQAGSFVETRKMVLVK